MAKRPRSRADRAGQVDAGWFHPAVVGLVFAVVGLLVYAPALTAPFFSDDQHYVQANAHIQNLSLENWIAIWSPTSVVVTLVENWAPVHLTLHALAWYWFGPDVLGHHVMGVLMHALASPLLYVFFVRVGFSRPVGVGLAAFFLVHPVGVEAVAWISQIKTTAALVLTLVALLCHPRHPGWALLAFALALLAKPAALVALPVAVAWGLVDRAHAERRSWLWAWGFVLAAFSVAELAAFYETAGRAPSPNEGLGERFRSHVGIVLRYVAMAATGREVGLFHEPAAARSLLDPWWLGGSLLLAAIAGRAWVSLRRRSPELVCWMWAAAAWAPASGLLTLPYPMADRYLYFVLPGLIGAAAFVAAEAWRAVPPRVVSRTLPRWSVWFVALLVLAGFGVAANRQATRWALPERLLLQTEQAYPDGQVARLRAARRAARAGDADAVVALLHPAMVRGFDRLDVLLSDPAYRQLRGHAGFDAIVGELARRDVDRVAAREDPSQVELRVSAQALFVLGELAASEEAYGRALELPGPHGQSIRTELEAVRLERRLEAVRQPR